LKDQGRPAAQENKTLAEIKFLRDLVQRCDSVDYARSVALRYARRFRREIGEVLDVLPRSDHRDFIGDVADFTIHRQL
jgi:geranylgeranyl pyrophosphate synthase